VTDVKLAHWLGSQPGVVLEWI